MAKKKLIPLREENTQVRSSGGEVINVDSKPIRPRTFLQDSFDMAPMRRTVEDLAAKATAGNQRRQNNTALSPADPQDWRPSYMRQQAQPALTQPQIIAPNQKQQTPASTNAIATPPNTANRQESARRQSNSAVNGQRMQPIGRFGAGNIDLFNRPQYRQPDGSLSTVNSISIGTDDGEVLIPTIGRDAQGRPVQWTDDEAIEQYNKTGQYLGKFNTVEEADRYADQLHRQQEIYYGSDIGKNDPVSMQRLMGIRGGIDRSGGVNQTIGNARDDVEILQGEPKNLTREGQWAARHPYAGTVMYGVTNVVGSGEGVFNTAEAALRALANNEKMDPNAVKSAPLAQAYRTGSAEGFRRGLQEGITAPVAKAIGIDSDDGRYSRGEQAMDFLSGVVADRVSSLMNMGIAGGLAARTAALTPAQMATIGTASGALMGANAAGQSLYETSSDEDTTARQALALGITSGIWEALFEAYSTESLLSNATPTSIKDLLVKTAAQFGVEFQEEAATEGANIISDYIIRGDNSEIGKDVAAFKANNPDADPNEVARHALLSALYQVSMAGLGGGLSGAMGGGVMALNQFRGGTQLRSGVRSGDVSLNAIANAADTSTPQGQRVYELANDLARREAEGQRNSAMRYGALNNAIINDIDANWETRLEQAASSANASENAIDRTNRIREALRGDNAQAAWEAPEDTGVRDVVLPSEMREEAAYDLLETRNADRISWDTEQGFVSLDRESDGSYTFTNERGETVTMDSQQAAELIPAEQMLTIYDYEGNAEAQRQELASAPSIEPAAPSTESTAPSTADTGINASANNVNANVERQNMVEARVASDAAADQNLAQSGGETAQQMAAQNPVAISQQNASGDQYVAQTANERLEEAARQVTQRRTVEKAAQLRAVYEARKNNSPNLRSVVNGATMLSQAEVTRALDMGARDAIVATSAQEEISNGRQEGESLSGQRGNGILSQRAGKQAGRVSAETEAVRRIWRSGEAPADTGAEVLQFAERRRASEVIPESSEDSFVFIPANKTELMEQGEAEAESFGLSVVSWAGGEAVSDKGNTFRGATVPGSDELYAQADNADFSQDKIIKHEIAENKLSKAEFEQIIEEAKRKSDFVKAAIEIYQSLSGEDEYRSAKELVCDSNGKMNQFEKRAQENPDNAGYQIIREILQRAIDTINPIVSEKLEAKKVQRTATSAASATKVSSLPGVSPKEKAESVNNNTEHSVELPYKFGSEAANAWVQGLEPEAKKTAEMFSELHDIGLHNKANVRVGVGAGSHMKRIDVTTRNMLASEWNSYIDSSETFADTAKKLAEALPDNVRKEANISKDGRILATPFEKEFKMMRSFMQRIVDALPIKLTGNTTMVNGKEVKISNKKQIYGVGGEEYRKALLEERRRQYREGILAKKSIGGLSKDTWGTMGFLAANTKTTASGDFTTFCPQMLFGNKGCWYCYRLSALRSGVNNKLVGEKVWYTGEILRLKQADIDALNKAGGLRIQSFGDWMDMFSPQLLDMLVDAETVGLQIKIITKEPSMIDTVALLKEQGFGKNLYFNLSADYTIEEQKGQFQPNPARPYMVKDGKTYWKRALSVEEANEYRKKYRWVNTRIVATNLDEFIRGLESPYVDVVTGYHGRDFAKSGFERISSEDGQMLTEVEALGDAGMPRFRFMPSTGTWVREFDGKTKTHKRLADAIEERGLQYAYYIKTCCQTGRCASCEGKCGALARDFNIKNATNRDTESVKYWQKVMRGNTSSIGGESGIYPFPHLLKTESFNQLSKEQEQRQAIYQAGLDMDEDYEDVIESANLIPMEERYRIFQDGMKAAQNRGNRSNANETATQTVPEGEDASSQAIASDMGVQHSTKITDEDLIKKLEKEIAAGDYIETYKAMQVVGGELYPPMAGKVRGTDGKYRMNNPYTLKAWHQSDEDLANAIFKPGNDKYAYYNLKKGDGSSDVPAAYNPYEHSSNTVLNDQFDTANKRGNLVVVRCLIPKSEIYGKDRYKAQFAKDSTGIIDWKSGEVSTRLKKLKPNEARVVYLSRYIKPVEIMKPEFVAGEWKKALDGTDLSVPFNVVTPELLSALEKLNVPINYAGTGNYQRYNKPKATKKADIETAADDKTNPNVIRQGSDQDIRYSSKLFDKNVDDRLKARMATLFSGGGTVDFAVRSIVQHEFAVEFKEKIAAVYRANVGGTMYVDDVRTVNINPHKGRVEYLHISPVCTDYSSANNKQGERDIDLKTAEAAARIIDELQPKVVTVENVRRYKNSRAVQIIEEALERNHYLHDKKVYRASDFGGATIRERMFIRAVKDGVLPKVDTSEYTPMTWYDAVKDMIPKLPPAELSNYMRGRLGVSGIDLDNLKQPVFVLGGEKSGELTFATADKPAPTILAKSTEARILMPDGRILRATPRVMARIQGLPDAFDLGLKNDYDMEESRGNVTNAYRVVGNGVPVQLTQGIVGPLLEENLIKQKSKETGIQYSSKLDSAGSKLTEQQVEYFKNSKIRDENGNLKRMYHGTKRADRVGTVFRPERATSGPMAYFTDDESIAKNYSRDKEDTSLKKEGAGDYHRMFRMNIGGKTYTIEDAWDKLPVSKRAEIRRKAPHITFDDFYENIIIDEDVNNGLGNFDNYLIRENKGNYIKALISSWLDDGTLYGDEERFQEVLHLAGLEDGIEYLDPNHRDEKVYAVYLNVTNPLVTNDIPQKVINNLRKASETVEWNGPDSNVDSWDKTNVSPQEWFKDFERDIENGTAYVWTRIPDWVTNVLKDMGYDGISDMGGKKGGVTHNVVIPFSSEQIKNIDNQNPTKDVDIRYSSKLQGDIDKKYDAALRSNDMKTAERLVKEAAEEAGYKLAAYHGTGENFTVFNPGFEGIHLGNREQAEDVAKIRFDQRSKNSNYKWKDIRNRVKEMNREQRESLVSAAYRLGDYYDAPADDFAFDGNIMNDKEVTDYVDREVEGYSKATGENNPGFTMRTFDRETNENVMELYAKINNPLVINGDIVDWEMEHITRLLKAIDHGDDKFLPLFRRDYIDISNAKLKLTSEDNKLLNKAVRTATSDTAVESWNALKEVLANHGYDGIQYKNEYEGDKSSWSYIALSPSDVKSAEAVTYDDGGNVIPPSERFNPANEDIRYSSKLNNPDYAPTFYSKLQREVQNFKGDKIGAASVESYLKGKGVKDEEIKWSGIRTFLEGKKSVNKQELMDYLKSNELEITESILSDSPVFEGMGQEFNSLKEIKNYLKEQGIEYEDIAWDDYFEMYTVYTPDNEYYFPKINLGNEDNETRWDDYKINGGTNYREILFRMPNSDYSNNAMINHWDREGVLAHARVQDFDADDGGKVLFIEEIQSDWHNAGQKNGYQFGTGEEQAKRIAEIREEANNVNLSLAEEKRNAEFERIVWKALEAIEDSGKKLGLNGFRTIEDSLLQNRRTWGYAFDDQYTKPAMDALTKSERTFIETYRKDLAYAMEREAEADRMNAAAPDAPFRTTYTDFVLKDLLRMAAEGDYDYLAWTTSNMQMERWNPSRQSTKALTGRGADNDVAFEEGYRIEYDQQIPKFLKKYGKQWGAGLSTISIGTGVSFDGLKQHIEQEKRVFKLVDDATGRVIASVTQDAFNKPGDEAEALARFREMTIGTPVQAIAVNDAMKESVLTEGQPMYSRSLTAGMSTQDLDKRINELVKKYGALPKGEKPARNVDVPMQTSDNKNTRRFVRTILESGITSADLDDSIKSAIINESLSYEVATDKDAAEYAASVIRIGGVERAQREWDKARRSDTFNKDHMALGQFLLKEYAKNNDVDNAMNMIQDLAAEGTRMGQNIQAMRMLKKYAQQVPAIGLGYIQRTVDQMNREAKAKMGKRYKEMRIAPNLAAEYIKAQTRDEIDAALGKIYKNLGSQVQKTVPEEIHDKLRTWRYMSMLGNPRTHIRNLVGNALFVPAVTLKNAIGTGLEGAMNTSTKTKSLTVTKQAMEFAKQDALDMQDVLSGESEKSIRDLIMDQRKVYKFEPLNKASKGNSAALEAEDWVFLRWHYQNALAQYITANHLDTTVQNPAWLGRARRYAVQEAQKATYRDANKVSTWLNQSKGAGAVVKYMMEGLMPFKKTPTNILRRGIEYSPAGLVRTMSKSIYDLNTGKMTVNEWIDALSSGLAGTAIFGIGMFLASTGAILGGYKDDDDKELRKLKGLQEYSVIIGNHTYTIDWAAPGSLPLFIGVETMNALQQERGMTMDDMGKAAARLIDPMINMSMLSGLNDTLDAISYSDDKLSAATMEMFYSLLGQYVPTLFGQVARTIDTTQRINYQDVNTGKPKNMLYFIEKMQNKIPFLTFSNDPYLNEFGQENSGTPHWAAALQNFVSPGYVSEIKDDHVLDEVARLNEAQDKEKVLPRKMNKYIGSGKDRIDLTSSEYHTFQKVAGQTAYNILDAMIDDKRYNSMNANQQATAIKVAYDYAKAVGRIEIQPKYKEDLDGKVKKVYEDVQNGMQAYDSILNRIRTDNVSEGIKPDLDENGNAIDNSAKYKTIDKILGTSMSKAEKARTFETAYPSKSLDNWKASGGDVYDYMMGVKLQQDVSKLSDEKKKKTYEYVVNSKDYTNYQKVAWFVSDKNRTESKNYLAWKDAKGSDWDYIKSRSDLEKFTGLDTKTRRSKVIGYIKRQTTNEAKRKALWQMAGYDLDSTKNKKTVKNGNYNKYFK